MVHTMLKNTGVSCQTKDTFEYFVFFFFPFLCFFISVLAFQFYTPPSVGSFQVEKESQRQFVWLFNTIDGIA